MYILIACQVPVRKNTVSTKESASNSKINHSSHRLVESAKERTKTRICLAFWVATQLNFREIAN